MHGNSLSLCDSGGMEWLFLIPDSRLSNEVYNIYVDQLMNMNKVLSTLILSVLVPLSGLADRAMPGLWQTKRLADGREVRVELQGDEHVHFWQAADGTRYVERGGVLRPTDAVEIESLARTSRLRGLDTDAAGARRYAPVARRAEYTGSRKGLIILVEFNDKSFAMDSPREYYDRMANEKGFSHRQQRGSVRDYFLEQSNGVFDLTFDVVGPVKMPSGYAYYGGDSDDGVTDVNVGSMLVSAINMVEGQVNWADYDWNGDNEVEQVYFIYAGGGQATGAGDNTIWPHKFNLRYHKAAGYRPVVRNGITIDTYACSNETNQYGRTAGIGTLCHEFSHCLGLPDIYDTSGNSGNAATFYGMGNWDIMNSGSYNNDGYTPAGYTSWERMMAGWLEPAELTGDAVVEGMTPLGEGGQSYVIYNPGFRNEYYMLEYRTRSGWDRYIPGEGMLILHVDYDENIFNIYNAANTYLDGINDHQRLTIFHADNTESKSNEGTDPYPYGNLNVLSNYSTPAATLYNANADGSKTMNMRLNRIRRNTDGTMSFVLGNPCAADKSLLFAESFDDCNAKGGNDGNWTTYRIAIGTFRPDNEGWQADYVRGGRHCARVGDTAPCDLVSPAMHFNGSATLSFRVAPFVAEGTMTLKLSTDNANVTLSSSTVELTSRKWTEFSTEVSGTGEARITFSADCRLYMDDILVRDNTGTGIEDMRGGEAYGGDDGAVYDLNGRRIAGTDAHGVYIRNGRKFIR